MRVAVLGGAGDVGRVAVRMAAHMDVVDEVVVADLDSRAARRIAESLEADATVTLRDLALDVTDSEALEGLLEEVDIVLNATGPFYRLGIGVLDAAIESGVHYLDVCDDPEPTLEMLERDGRAREMGVTAIIGMGASPGLSNLLAASALRELDEPEAVYTAWPVDPEELGALGRGASAALVHWLHQLSGTVPVLRDGAIVSVPPLEALELDYPGIGAGTVYSVGHPEPLTLARAYPSLKQGLSVMVAPPNVIAAVRELAARVDSGELDAEAAAELMAEAALEDASPDASGGPGKLPPFFAWASGQRNGEPAVIGALLHSLPAGMANATGIPLALGLEQLIECGFERPGPGVFAPERALDPEELFERLVAHCDPPLPNVSELLSLVAATG